MKKFKLMQIVPELNSGGVEQGTIDLANYLGDQEYNNLIVSNGGKMLSYLKKKYVNHYKLAVNSKNFFKMPFIAKEINKLIKDNSVDILHVRSRAPAWILPYIYKDKIKSVSTFHNVYGNNNLIKRMYNKQLSNVDHIIAISNYVKYEIMNIYDIESSKIKVINRGTDINFFNLSGNSDKDFNDFLFKYNIDLEKKIILYPGRLTSWKGQIEFLDIVKYFKDQPLIFYFVGDTKNLSFYDKLIKKINKYGLDKNCKVLGHLDKKKLKMMYKCSDIIISAPLKPEGFGRTISEALAMKKIVLAYNFGGAKDQIEKLSSIYSVEPFNSDELRKKIVKVLNLETEEIDKLGYLARNYIIQNFSKEAMLKSYKSFYEEILD